MSDVFGLTIPPSPLLSDLALSRYGHDRRAEERGHPGIAAAVMARAGNHVLLVRDGTVPVRSGAAGSVLHLLRTPLPLPPGADAVGGPVVIVLGSCDGATIIAVADAAAAQVGMSVPDGVSWRGLREVGSLLGDSDVGLAVEAIALENWHRTHPRCPRCGAATLPTAAGHERRCPVDRSTHHPRTDPAVIMLVLDDDDRVLLGRQATWPHRRYSVLAGFVEPGESLEAAVARETFEESGIVVGSTRYLGSQPWPFPASIMLAFEARALTTDITVDGSEIVEACWFSRDELVGAVADTRVLLPPRLSIARRMLQHWAGSALGEDTPWR